jgi:hypothetical protein
MVVGEHLLDLRFLYVGVGDTDAAVEDWVDGLGATLRWRFVAFGADVAGIELGTGPLVLLADHRPPGSVLPIWEVDSLADVLAGLDDGPWVVTGPLGTPEGDAVVLTADGGAELALLEVVRPGAMDDAYADPGNNRRVR